MKKEYKKHLQGLKVREENRPEHPITAKRKAKKTKK
jgi:hypothetical protein